MKDATRNVLIGIGVAVLVIIVVLVAQWNRIFPPDMSLTSSVFQEGGTIPQTYTCDGAKTHPPLTIANIPKATSSLAVMLYDPDAPNGGYVHWVLYNISPHDVNIPAGTKVPAGSNEGLNGSKTVGYAPPCPPAGSSHRYIFTAYALDQLFPFKNPPDMQSLKKVMRWHVLAKAELTGRYAR